MNYLITQKLSATTIRLFRTLQACGEPAILVYTHWQLRSREQFAAAGLNASEARYYLDLIRPSRVIAEPKIPAADQFTAKRVTPQVVKFYDARQQLRLLTEESAGKLWRVVRFSAAGRQLQTDWYDSRGFLSTTVDDQASIEFDSAGERILTTNLQDDTVRLDFAGGRQAQNRQAAIAAILDAVYQPGDRVLSVWDNGEYRGIARALNRPYAIQVGFLKDAGTTPFFPVLARVVQADEMAKSQAQTRREAGRIYYVDPQLDRHFHYGQEVTRRFNELADSVASDYLRQHIGGAGVKFYVAAPARLHAAVNLHVGENFFCNTNGTFMDDAPIVIGDNARIGPDCAFYTSGHPLNPLMRNSGYGQSAPIRIGHNLWMGGGAIVLGGVTLGNNVVIAAGAVVTKSFGDNCLIGGIPAKRIRQLDPADDRS